MRGFAVHLRRDAGHGVPVPGLRRQAGGLHDRVLLLRGRVPRRVDDHEDARAEVQAGRGVIISDRKENPQMKKTLFAIAAGGIAASIFFGFIIAMIFNPKQK